MTRPTRTVYSTLPLEISGAKHPAGTALHVFEEDATALIAGGRATENPPGKVADLPAGPHPDPVMPAPTAPPAKADADKRPA